MCFCSFESCKARGVHYFEKIQILYAQGFCVSRFFHFAFPLFEDISEPACGASLAAVSGASCNRARIVPKEERGRGGLKGTIFLLFLYHIQKICQADTIFMFHIGVFALILDKERRVLLCHRRDRDLWNLPGGKLESNEAPWEGVMREVKEEVGLTVIPERIIDISSK